MNKKAGNQPPKGLIKPTPLPTPPKTTKEMMQDIEKSMFDCPKLHARITPQTCINNQTKKTNNLQFMKLHQWDNPCENCQQGIKNLPEYKGEEIEQKTCEAYKQNPALCQGTNNGIFYRQFSDHDTNWNRKKYCNEGCRRSIANIRRGKKTIDYLEYDFCRDIKCKMLIQNECIMRDPANCIYTAKELYEWLVVNKYKINKMKEKK